MSQAVNILSRVYMLPYGYAIVVGGWIFAFLGALAVGLRIWSRRLKRQELVLNDWLAVAALAFNIALMSHATHSIIVYGPGQHADIIGAYNVGQILKSLFGLKPECAFANALVRLSILHLYTTIFPMKWFRITAYTVMVLAILYSIAAFLEIFLSCFPMAYIWDPAEHPGGYCISLAQAWLAVGLVNMIEDVIIILLPLPALWSLKLDPRKKLALSAVFSLGIFIIAVTAIRIKVIIDFDPLDSSGHLGPITFWSILEPLLGLINCCLPVMQPVISKLTGQRLWSGAESKQAIYDKWNRPSHRSGLKHGQSSDVDDLYPLATVDIVAKHDRLDIEQGSQFKEEIPGAITVEQRWEVSRK